MKFDCIVTSWRTAILRPSRAVGAAIAAGVVVLLLSLFPADAMEASDPADDDFETGGLDGGTGWLDGWQTSGSVDIVNYGGSLTDSRHLRLRAGDGTAYRDVELTGSERLELTVWVRADSFSTGDFATLQVGEPGSLVEVQRWDASLGLGSGPENAGEYHLFTFDLEPYFTGGLLRIQFDSHMADGEGQLLVDEVVISNDEPPQGSAVAGGPPSSASFIELDGEFQDWVGRANIVDPFGDARNARGDIIAFHWANDPDDDTAFWMIERPPGLGKSARYSLHLDMNDDGDFTDAVDRIVEVWYAPGSRSSRVDTRVRQADNNQLIAVDRKRDWGETISEGSSRVEFGVPYSDLGFSFGSVFRTYVESSYGDRAPDTGDVQWTAIPILGYVGVGAALLVGGFAIWWFRLRKHEGLEVPQS
ncbi:MAG: hypothetical protein IH861_05070 [Chloroflexi bacterium]|nr:hypothetical protein [Chloroflexota bacterium]